MSTLTDVILQGDEMAGSPIQSPSSPEKVPQCAIPKLERLRQHKFLYSHLVCMTSLGKLMHDAKVNDYEFNHKHCQHQG